MGHAAVIEILDRDGRCRESHKVRHWPFSIGRSPDCDVVLADPHVAAAHALVHWQAPEVDGPGAADAGGVARAAAEAATGSDLPGGPRLELLPSLNGGWLEGERLVAGQSRDWSREAIVQIGATRLRLRLARDPLPQERPLVRADEPLRGRGMRPRWALPLLLAAWMLMWSGLLYVQSNPGMSTFEAASGLLFVLGAALAGAVLWALVTQLFRHWFAFGAHLWRLLIASGLFVAVDYLLPAIAYAFSWPALMTVEGVLKTVLVAAALWWHATVIWPRGRRSLALGVSAMALLVVVLPLGRRTEAQHWLRPNYLGALPPPALRVVEPRAVDDFVDGLASLEAPLKAQAGKRNNEDSVSGDNEE